tara:strand:+ start:358 stop:879 length:522 start_codon:yes stop_codon:yes gene_type:complete
MQRTNNPRGSQTGIAGLAKEKSFRVEFYSEMEGTRYDGTFSVKRPTIFDQTQIAARKSTILGGKYHDTENPGSGVPSYMDDLAEMMAFLAVTIVNHPPWWDHTQDGGGISDPGLMAFIFQEAAKADPFRSPDIVNVDGVRGSGEDSNHQRNEAGTNDVLTSLVDEKIPIASNQ